MADDQSVLRLTMRRALSGKDSHIEVGKTLAGLDWRLAGVRPDGVPHSVLQLVNHISYWQEWAVKWLDGKKPKVPRHAAGSWPGKVSPRTRQEWERTVKRSQDLLKMLDRRARDAKPFSKGGTMTRLEMLHLIGSHTSYHIGQVVFLRQLLGAWPPPSGGVTW